jgi:hypothetical protein
MKALKRAIMKVARSRMGGALASFCVRRCLCLLPVKVEASSAEFNLCIANMDKKKTDFLFFQEGKTKSMYKRVDHLYCLTISPAVKPDCITLTGSIA